jgi:transposase
MVLDLEADKLRLELLERFRAQRAILAGQINEATKFLADVDKRIAELERAALGGASRARSLTPVPGLDAPTPAAPEIAAKTSST